MERFMEHKGWNTLRDEFASKEKLSPDVCFVHLATHNSDHICYFLWAVGSVGGLRVKKCGEFGIRGFRFSRSFRHLSIPTPTPTRGCSPALHTYFNRPWRWTSWLTMYWLLLSSFFYRFHLSFRYYRNCCHYRPSDFSDPLPPDCLRTLSSSRSPGPLLFWGALLLYLHACHGRRESLDSG